MSHSCISDITPLTALDYPGKTACILWFSLCNLRCKYCYNTSFIKGGKERWDQCSTLNFLKQRAGFLEGVVLSGGECTLYPALIPLAKKIKALGYKVKLDTNGTRPEMVKRLIEERLVDYVALDYKADRTTYEKVTGRSLEYDRFTETLDYLIEQGFDFEIRTTLHADLIDEEVINAINDDLYRRGYKGMYYIQNYFHTDGNLGKLKKPRREFQWNLVRKQVPMKLRNPAQSS